MATPSGYVREIKSMKDEIKRTNERMKALRLQLKTTQTHLYNYMVAHNLEEFENIKAAKIKPVAKPKQKTKAQKRQEGVELFYTIGVPDPETLYEQFLSTQKAKPVPSAAAAETGAAAAEYEEPSQDDDF